MHKLKKIIINNEKISPSSDTMHFYNFSQKKVTDYTEYNFPFKIILQIIVLHFSKAILIGFDILDVCTLYTYRKIRR